MLAGLAAIIPARAHAQNRHESSTTLGLWAGMFSPLGTDPSASSIGTSIDRPNSFAGGARLTFWGTNILGVEAVAGLTPAKVDVAGATVNETRSLNIFAAGVKLMVGLSPSMSPVGFHIGAGPAIVRRGNDVVSQSNSKTNLGGVFGAGFRFPINATLGIRLDAEAYIYKGTIGGEEKTRNNLITSAGLTIKF
jgi:hypothetical protein